MAHLLDRPFTAFTAVAMSLEAKTLDLSVMSQLNADEVYS